MCGDIDPQTTAASQKDLMCTPNISRGQLSEHEARNTFLTFAPPPKKKYAEFVHSSKDVCCGEKSLTLLTPSLP